MISLPFLKKAIYVSKPDQWMFSATTILLLSSHDLNFLKRPDYLLCLFFSTFPTSLLVYSMNDYADFEIDKLNKRKSNKGKKTFF
jgi:4-hydroxybenzoate polyprenyltransferase